ncbi:MAG: InlB B-repeat-containing protein [Clostridia bacterium]|nr:InlB B-repeat-containing protein [Clostridia bacterium]
MFIGAYRRTGGTPDLIFPTFNNVESLYLPYNSGGLRQGGIPYTYIKEREKSLDYFSTLDIGPKNIYFLFSRTTLLETWIQTKSDYAGIENFYIPNFRFEEVKKAFKLLCKNKTDCSLIFEKNPPILDTFFVIRANTTYYFNYEESPNEDIFFINDFERGEKIENTPYEPTREGYKFKGWYKEPECVNAWNFEEDRLPAPEYYENGELKYVETCLYAKWEKN